MRNSGLRKKEPTRSDQSKKRPRKKAGAASNVFEVDSIVGSRIIHGQQQYRIHWTGHPSSSDTWEVETNLNCPELVKKYLQEVEDRELDEEEEAEQKSGSKRKGLQVKGTASKKSKDVNDGQSNGDGEASSSSAKAEEEPKAEETPKKSLSKEPIPSKDEEEDDEVEYEVEQIVGVSVDSKGRKTFLIKWKGYGPEDNTWEPESHLDCRQLIDEYLISNPILDDEDYGRKTRVNPRKVDRFPVSPMGKRRSRRSHGRSRATYYDQE